MASEKYRCAHGWETDGPYCPTCISGPLIEIDRLRAALAAMERERRWRLSCEYVQDDGRSDPCVVSMLVRDKTDQWCKTCRGAVAALRGEHRNGAVDGV